MKTTIRDRNNIVAEKSVSEQLVLESGVTLESNVTKSNVYVTKITLAATTFAVANASLGFGKKLFTFPKGNVHVLAAHLDLTYASSVANTIQADIGIGTVIASGVVAVLSGTATFEDIIDGITATAFNGVTAVNYEANKTAEVDIKDGASTAKAAHLNVAGAWTGVTGDLTYSGVVTLIWAIVQ